MSWYTREKCAIEGCNNQQRNKGMVNGHRVYGRVCVVHHKGQANVANHMRQRIPNRQCEVCGWDEAYCDRHRLVPENGYVPENVVVLCPNHHRMVETGKLVLRGKKQAA